MRRIRFLLRRWYWNQPFVIRAALSDIGRLLFAFAVGIGYAVLIAQGI